MIEYIVCRAAKRRLRQRPGKASGLGREAGWGHHHAIGENSIRGRKTLVLDQASIDLGRPFRLRAVAGPAERRLRVSGDLLVDATGRFDLSPSSQDFLPLTDV